MKNKKIFGNQYEIAEYKETLYVILAFYGCSHSGYRYLLGDISTGAKIRWVLTDNVIIHYGYEVPKWIKDKRKEYWKKERIRLFKYKLRKIFLPWTIIKIPVYELKPSVAVNNELVEACPMSKPSGEIFYMEYKYGDKK